MAFDDDLELQIRPRSGFSKEYPLIISNSPATIDAGYRGEIMIFFRSLSNYTIRIPKGTKVAQGVFAPVVRGEFTLSDELPESERGDNGFGSTDKDTPTKVEEISELKRSSDLYHTSITMTSPLVHLHKLLDDIIKVFFASGYTNVHADMVVTKTQGTKPAMVYFVHDGSDCESLEVIVYVAEDCTTIGLHGNNVSDEIVEKIKELTKPAKG